MYMICLDMEGVLTPEIWINVAELILNLPSKAPVLNKTRNQQVRVSITQENSHAN